MRVVSHRLTGYTFFIFLLHSMVMPVPGRAFLEGNDVDAFLETLLKEDYPVSYKAQEIEIAFSGGQTEIHRYKIGKLKPFKMRKEKYSIYGTMEEVLSHDGELMITYNPARRVVVRSPVVMERRSPETMKELISLIKRNYHVRFLGNAMVSGRGALAFSIEPRMKGTRPSFRVWMDHETAVPLKTEVYSIKGDLSYLSALFDVEINPSFPQDYFVIMVPSGTRAYELSLPARNDSGDSEVDTRKRYFETIPGGYVFKEAKVDGDGQVQVVYHDGLNSISIFLNRWNHEGVSEVGKVKTGKGEMVEKITLDGVEGYFCSRDRESVVSFVSNRRRYTVVGAISREGLIDIALELKKRGLVR